MCDCRINLPRLCGNSFYTAASKAILVTVGCMPFRVLQTYGVSISLFLAFIFM